MQNSRNILKVCLITLFWLGIWQLLSWKINEEILMVSPLVTIRRIFNIVSEESLYLYIFNSFIKIFSGFLMGILIGTILALISYLNKFAKDIIFPFIIFLKSVPIAAFIILILIWSKSKNLSVFVSTIMVTPIIYSNIYEGFLSTDKKMLEMSKIYKLSFWKKIKYIYMPHISSYILAGIISSVGISWKSGLTAEVIGLPINTIGEQIYNAKIFLDTETLFAYIVIIVLISIATEKIVSMLLKKIILKRYFND